jgi:hypothetical protein
VEIFKISSVGQKREENIGSKPLILNRVRVQKGEERWTIPRSYESFGKAREERQRNMPVFLQGLRKQTYLLLLSRKDKHVTSFKPFEDGSDQYIERSALFGRREKK